MYESTMHGNLEAVQLLLKHGANPHIKSKVDQHEFESNLEVASRWNHIKIVEFLLEATVWSYIEVKHAAKVASNVAIKKTLIEYLNKHYVRRLCCFKRYFK
jgi:ankyrin repeat protein